MKNVRTEFGNLIDALLDGAIIEPPELSALCVAMFSEITGMPADELTRLDCPPRDLPPGSLERAQGVYARYLPLAAPYLLGEWSATRANA
ncbi:hypothetical protein AB3X94_37415 [Paraburkholderia sp. BR10923]|uniref:hypothetical protein n=1 Tax=Paraburkholderia sp. BR10923 TaxID=3236992 RepID=UPI0034CEEDB0